MDLKRLIIGAVLIILGGTGVFLIGTFTTTVSLDVAENIAKRYLSQLDNPDLAIDEIMEFEFNFYVIYYEKSTDIGAFEMLIDKSSGRIFPEYGPNMMWNLKYGHGGMMGSWRAPPSTKMPIDKDESLKIAQKYLDETYPGLKAEESHQFYGYYTIHVTKNNQIFGMLSVNGYDGAVWYHSWHGRYIQSRELEG
ncbi:hypothetical protein KEJ47_09360 [Candidatus Bathyarchaeota archaeon]|nr:hypothetical protein [Candidatus Bathyarchaeota archaeon]